MIPLHAALHDIAGTSFNQLECVRSGKDICFSCFHGQAAYCRPPDAQHPEKTKNAGGESLLSLTAFSRFRLARGRRKSFLIPPGNSLFLSSEFSGKWIQG